MIVRSPSSDTQCCGTTEAGSLAIGTCCTSESSSTVSLAGQVDSFSFVMEEPYDGDYLIGLNMPFSGIIASMTIFTQSGSGKASVRIGEEVIEGLDEVSIPAEDEVEFLAVGDNSFDAGDDIYFVVSENLIMLNLTVTITFRRNASGFSSTEIISADEELTADSLVVTNNITAGGIIAGDSFQGDGSALTGVALSAHVHSAADITSGTMATARLGSGTASGSTFLAGDQTYKTIDLSGYAPLSGNLSQFAATTSAQLKSVLSDELGSASGKAIFAEGTLAIASGKTFTASNTLTLTGTDSSTLNIGTGGTLGTAAYTASGAYQPIDSDLTSWAAITRASGFDTFATTPSSANLISLVTDETGTGALVFGTSPTFTTGITTPLVTGSAAGLSLAAGGTNQNITLTPSGSGSLVTGSIFKSTNGIWLVTNSATTPTTRAVDLFQYSTLMSMASTYGIAWESGATIVASKDTGLHRNAAGVVEINNGTAGTYRDLLARGVRHNAVAFSSAISSPSEGTIQAFTDSSVNTWGATITGGGANHVLGYYNGTNWTVFAI